MPVTTVDALIVDALNADHVRKGKKVGVFCAPMSEPVPTSLTTGGVSGAPITLTALSAGWEPIGLLRKDDAIGLSRDRDTSTVDAVGFNDPVRTDYTSDVFTAKIVALETRRITIEKFLNVDLSAIVPNADTGEISFPQPSDVAVTKARWLFIAQDGQGADRIWWSRLFLAGWVSETDDQSMGATDDAWQWPMTISSQTDTDAGYSVQHAFGGPGFQARLESMGFSA
jgi:hypothetical protein